MPTWNPRANELFLKALDMRSPGERQAYLDEACAGDAALRAEVEALLDASARAGQFLESPAAELPPGFGEAGSEARDSATVDAPIRERPGTVIGPYKLLEQIGEGGFGVVFLAEQTQPVRRKVALKIVKPGMDTRQVIVRFEAERQALAIMDHPNIAKVLDGGATAAGRPYFVMELVKGVPITDFCDQNHLTPRQRLELFVPVCQAVQHAHHKGIIHRDLKPSNVMVTVHDTTPVVKVIDFGVAKALGQELTDKTLFTAFAEMIGTPLYMSPEQAGQSGLDIDTRSDIYSLGVLLYELLTGTTPFTKERFKQVAYDEIRRIIREEEPPKPSTRLSDSTASLPSISAQRQTEPAKLTKLMRGELDWIVMKALEKDRNRRYQTASIFAADVQRYLQDEPVEACPPSKLYRLRKFARKHAKLLTTAAAFLAILLTATVASIALATWAVRAEHETRQEQQKTEAALGRETAARKKTRQALSRISDRVVEATFTRKAQLTEEDQKFLREILEDHERFAAEAGDSADARDLRTDGYLRVAVLRDKLGELREAEAAFRAALENQTRLVDDFPAVPEYRRQLAICNNNLGRLLNRTGRPPEAEASYRRAVELWEKLTAESPATAAYRHELSDAYTNLGALLDRTGRPEEADRVNGQALQMLEKLVAEFPAVPEYLFALARNRQNAGANLADAGRSDEAEAASHRAVELYEQLVTRFPSIPDYRSFLAEARMNLGALWFNTDRQEKAGEQIRLALGLWEALVAEFPAVPGYRSRVATAHYNLAVLLDGADRHAKAEAEYLQAEKLFENLVASFPTVTDYRHHLGGTLNNLAHYRLDRNDLAGARQLVERAIEQQSSALKSNPREPTYRQFLGNHYRTFADILVRQGQHAEAVNTAAEAPRLYPGSAEERRRAAEFLARCVPLAEKDSKLPADKRKALAGRYAHQAVELLRGAVQRGYKDVEQLKEDAELDPLRAREDFKKLIAELESKGK